MKRTILFITTLCCCLTFALADQPSKTEDRELRETIMPRMAFALMEGEKSGPIHLLASTSAQDEINLVPSNVNVVSALETPVLVSVDIPKDKHRTHLLLVIDVEHDWTQIPSAAPYRMLGSFSFFLTSTALPSPGRMRIRLPLDSQIDSQQSTVEIFRQRDPAQSLGFDEKTITFIVKGTFPALSDEQALETTRALLQSDLKIEMKLQVRLQSVSDFNVGGASMMVWGD